jgi:trimethylamine:corrinoid methyltransferase-like protein
MTFAEYPFTPAEARRIHQASLEILVQVGVTITHPGIRTLLLDAGALERKDSARSVTSALVEDALQKAPARGFVGFRAMAEDTRKHLRPGTFTPKDRCAGIEKRWLETLG